MTLTSAKSATQFGKFVSSAKFGLSGSPENPETTGTEITTLLTRCKIFGVVHHTTRNEFVVFCGVIVTLILLSRKERAIFSRTQHGQHVTPFFDFRLRVTTRIGFLTCARAHSEAHCIVPVAMPNIIFVKPQTHLNGMMGANVLQN